MSAIKEENEEEFRLINRTRVQKNGKVQQKAMGGKESGFTLVEVLMVVVILGVLSTIVIPKVSASSESARRNADIATAHQVKTALDRYQVENGVYPKKGDITVDINNGGKVTSTTLFIPNYIAKLDANTTQQLGGDLGKGFGVADLVSDGTIPDTKTNLIMIYLNTDGSAAEVRAYDAKQKTVLWSSAN